MTGPRSPIRPEEADYVCMSTTAGAQTLRLLAATTAWTWSRWLLNAGPFICLRASLLIFAGYIPPDANASSALGHLHDSVKSHQSMYPEAVHFVAVEVQWFPHFYQHVKCATKGENTLDKVYSNIKLGFMSTSGPVRPNFSALIPEYNLPRKVLLPHPELLRPGPKMPLISCRTSSS